jgi:hypothetical protein
VTGTSAYGYFLLFSRYAAVSAATRRSSTRPGGFPRVVQRLVLAKLVDRGDGFGVILSEVALVVGGQPPCLRLRLIGCPRLIDERVTCQARHTVQ